MNSIRYIISRLFCTHLGLLDGHCLNESPITEFIYGSSVRYRMCHFLFFFLFSSVDIDVVVVITGPASI